MPIETITPRGLRSEFLLGSIHPQGWVPIETKNPQDSVSRDRRVAFTPKGGCPLKPLRLEQKLEEELVQVAFTPKGGCPLKLGRSGSVRSRAICSIHPQGWVPIETYAPCHKRYTVQHRVAFTPKGGCPLKQRIELDRERLQCV